MKEPMIVPIVSNQQEEEANILPARGGGEDGQKEEKKKIRKKNKKNKKEQVLDGKIDRKKDGKTWWNQETIHLIFQEVAEKRITQIEASKKVDCPKSTFNQQFHLWVKKRNIQEPVVDSLKDRKKDEKICWNQEVIHLIFQQVAEKQMSQRKASKKLGSPKSTFHEQFHLWVKRTNNNP